MLGSSAYNVVLKKKPDADGDYILDVPRFLEYLDSSKETDAMALPDIYTDENAARKHLESLLWADGPVCPHCGVVNEATLLQGKSTRPGVYKCRPCQKPFSVTVGTVFERSKIGLHLWVYASHLMTSSKKGISSHQLHRMLGVTYKTAWFMSRRIRPLNERGVLGPIPLY